ncbi:MAG TPA: acetyl-CoA carboxylase biotin carboxyl carrier protein [Methylomirabilota bacterium]|nr:acetyl-CoA carboxylase biotin carboxyl carrier protein [Methylomirabilota bacterium]
MARRRPARNSVDPAGFTIDQVVELAVRHNLAELEVEGAGTRIRIVREHGPAASGSRAEATPAATAALPQPAAEAVESTAHLLTVEAPMVGTFYRAPKPDAPPFVAEGDVVKEGQILCIVEAMKLMNEIESKVAGRVVKVVVENGQPVEFGQPLFLLEPLR